MRILVTNDDGIHAPGLKIAEEIAHALSDDVWVVAPETEQSGASHSLTLTLPLRVREISPRRFAINGTPTDCVMMACLDLMKDALPALVLSGINAGSNIADDVTYSGTIAAAMEGCALGIASIALSQAYDHDSGEIGWSSGAVHGPALIRRLVEIGWPQGTLLSVNFPGCAAADVAGIEAVAQGERDLQSSKLVRRIDARGRPYYWLGFHRRLSKPPAGTDLKAIQERKICVTPLHMNLTEHKVLEKMRQSLGQTLAKS
ncbi:MAG TPA: 5'/3'-nucleotidase SurE [Rhizomicrobium sp.]